MKDNKPGPDARLTERRVVAWLGRAVHIEGRVMSAEDLVIDGQVDGSIELPDHNLTIGPNGEIRADLSARHISISGTVTGNVTALERLELLETGTVSGNISTPRLLMADGAVVTGRVEAGRR
ncbi:MAG TPA: polymer-forming cytoskeletal protein [Vicinamibacterales bacterium]|nr:polymer-forming cytoskeletal protein [Vicinamibacterales bacterium]